MESGSIESIIEEHRPIAEALDVLDTMCARIERRETFVTDDAFALVEFLREYADQDHHTKEESILFPALLDAGILRYGAAVRGLLMEHGRGRSLILGLEDALRCDNLAGFAEYGRHLVEMMRAHLYKEEHLLFPIARQLLNAERDRGIVDRLERADAEAGSERRTRLIKTLRRLHHEYRGGVRQSAGAGDSAQAS